MFGNESNVTEYGLQSKGVLLVGYLLYHIKKLTTAESAVLKKSDANCVCVKNS
jgi:hypothetical protein